MDDTNCGIYSIKSPSGNIYIGQSSNIDMRWSSYKYFDRNYCPLKKRKYTSLMYRSLKKYGYDKHIFSIICKCHKSKLNELEKHYIEQFKSNKSRYPEGNGLNLTDGGDNPPIRKFQSEVCKNKISIKNKQNHKEGKYKKRYKPIVKMKSDTFEVIAVYDSLIKCAQAEEKSVGFFTRNFTEFNKLFYDNFIFSFVDDRHFTYPIKSLKENKTKNEKPIKPKKIKEEKIKTTNLNIDKKQNRSKASLKRKSKDEWGAFFSQINKGRKHINRRSPLKTQKVLAHYEKLHKSNCVPVHQYDIHGNFIRSFESVKQAAEHMKCCYQGICRVCAGGRKTTGGFMWSYEMKKI